MEMIILTALGVGGATVFGALIGFAFRRTALRFGNAILAFAAGLMLAAAVLGLILPAAECGNLTVVIGGIFAGALCIHLMNRLVPHMYGFVGLTPQNASDCARIDQVLLFVTAMAVHNLPEGLAAGISFGTGNSVEALLIAGCIALQNIPEGMVTIVPMLAAGIPPRRAFLCAGMTGLVEVFGTLLGYVSIRFVACVMPFALAFAGGTMLYVICDEMIPDTRSGPGTAYALLAGFCLMLAFEILLT